MAAICVNANGTTVLPTIGNDDVPNISFDDFEKCIEPYSTTIPIMGVDRIEQSQGLPFPLRINNVLFDRIGEEKEVCNWRIVLGFALSGFRVFMTRVE